MNNQTWGKNKPYRKLKDDEFIPHNGVEFNQNWKFVGFMTDKPEKIVNALYKGKFNGQIDDFGVFDFNLYERLGEKTKLHIVYVLLTTIIVLLIIK